MDFRVLGAVEVVDEGRPVPLGGGKPRALLAALLLRHGRAVPVAALVDDLWGDRPPSSAEKLVQLNVSKLRAVLGPCLRTTRRAYLLDIPPATIDVARFRQLAERALRAEEPAEAAQWCTDALTEWRGPPAADVELLGPSRGVVVELEAVRWSVVERRIDLEMRLGGAARLLPELEGLVSAEPLREHLRAQLMRALAAGGRRAEALAVYRTGRSALVEELGVEPGEELQRLHHELLRDAPIRPQTAAPTTGLSPAPAPPTALPGSSSAAPAVRRRAGWIGAAAVMMPVGVAIVVGWTLRIGPAAPSDSDTRSAGARLPSTVQEVDPQSHRVIGQLPMLRSLAVGQGEGPLAAGDRFVWVRNGLDETLSQIDIQGGDVVHTTRVGAGTGGGITIAAGDVWVANTLDGSVSRVDGTTGELVATILVGPFPQGLTSAGGFVWVASSRSSPSGSLWRIDTASNLVAGRSTVSDRGSPAGPSWLAAAGDSVWAAVPDLGALVRLDARTGRRTGVVPVPSRAVCGGVSASDQAVWVASGTCGDGGLTRIDPATNQVVTRIRPSYWTWSVSVASGDHDVWVMADNGLYRIDPTTNRVSSALSLRTGVAVSGDVATGNGSVWVHDGRSGTVVRLRAPD